MPPDRHLLPVDPGAPPSDTDVQQLVEAERGHGTQGVLRTWLASNSDQVVLLSDSNGVRISRDAGATDPTHVVNDGTTAGGMLSGTYPNPSLSDAIIDALVPPGTIIAWAGDEAAYPAGWLPCRGELAARASYPKLFAAIGTIYNTGGEAGTDFRLPNLLGRVILGTSPSRPRGQTGGRESADGHTHPGTHAHGLNSHTHGLTDHAHAGGTHSHDLQNHTHNLDHDHAAATATASGSTLNGRFTAGGADALPDTHTHAVNLPPLGVQASGVPSLNTSTGATGNTGGLIGTPDTGTAAGSTATDPTAHAASYPATDANLPPYQSIPYIIRAGS